jgi:hypothetical protein
MQATDLKTYLTCWHKNDIQEPGCYVRVNKKKQTQEVFDTLDELIEKMTQTMKTGDILNEIRKHFENVYYQIAIIC